MSNDTKERKEWRSISASVSKEIYDEFSAAAAARGTTVASLIKRAVKIYVSAPVTRLAASIAANEDHAILAAVAEYERALRQKDEASIVERLLRLEVWLHRVAYLVTGRNPALCRQIQEQAEEAGKEYRSRQQVMSTNDSDAIATERPGNGR